MGYVRVRAWPHVWGTPPQGSGPEDWHEAFRRASESGGTSPTWTEYDPHEWGPSVPHDAAGGLYWQGRTWPAAGNEQSVKDALTSVVDTNPDDLVAAYFPSGGSGVFLLTAGYILIARAEPKRRLGFRGRSLASVGYQCQVYGDQTA